MDTVWLNDSIATTARRIQQDLSMKDRVLKNCSSVLLQSDGSFGFQERAVITETGNWTAPAGVTKLRLILVGNGDDGANGQDGTWDAAGADGADGSGGRVLSITIDINPQQAFAVSFGDVTTFGAYSTANGVVYPNGYTDVASGESYARTGVRNPLPGYGDGGAGGAGGIKGNQHSEIRYDKDGKPSGSYTVIDNYPGEGQPGRLGVSGCVIVYWDKEAIG